MGTCATGSKQSPINVDTSNLTQNSYIKYQLNYDAIENQTLLVLDAGNRIMMNISKGQNLSSSEKSNNNTIEIWNERGEHYTYHLDHMLWNVKSEHTINNHQYEAELQIYHKQFATNKIAAISILYDLELTLNTSATSKPKTCFVESFKFTQYK